MEREDVERILTTAFSAGAEEVCIAASQTAPGTSIHYNLPTGGWKKRVVQLDEPYSKVSERLAIMSQLDRGGFKAQFSEGSDLLRLANTNRFFRVLFISGIDAPESIRIRFR